MPDYRNESGRNVSQEESHRICWIGLCFYWTDDWDLLSRRKGTPACPQCEAPGYQTEFVMWTNGAVRFESDDHPHYLEFVRATKERCLGKRGTGIVLEAYEEWVANEYPTIEEVVNVEVGQDPFLHGSEDDKGSE